MLYRVSSFDKIGNRRRSSAGLSQVSSASRVDKTRFKAEQVKFREEGDSNMPAFRGPGRAKTGEAANFRQLEGRGDGVCLPECGVKFELEGFCTLERGGG